MQKLIVVFLLIFLFNSNLFAIEKTYFLMLKNNKVNVRHGPSLDYPIKFIYNKKFLPIKIIDKKENFRKIIDHKKNSGWIHISLLRKSKSLITTSNKILFKRPTKFSKPIVKLEKGRLVIIKRCKINWCRIETGNYSGWIETKNVWGI